MGRLLYTNNIPFSLKDWEKESIRSVYAGTDCIMAVTDDGRVLQKCRSDEYAAHCQYWTRIRQIAISKCYPGSAVGLVSDGTCMISKRPVRNTLKSGYRFRHTFEEINNEVKSWKDIVQVDVSDAFFALDSSGRVHHMHYSQRMGDMDEYASVSSWKDVRRIVTGLQSAVFGITNDGRILCAGRNCTQSPHGNMQDVLSKFTDVLDLCPTGSECEEVIVLKKDGTITDCSGTVLFTAPADSLDGVFCYTVMAKTADGRVLPVMNRNLPVHEINKPVFPENWNVTSFAVGSEWSGNAFVIAVGERR